MRQKNYPIHGSFQCLAVTPCTSQSYQSRSFSLFFPSFALVVVPRVHRVEILQDSCTNYWRSFISLAWSHSLNHRSSAKIRPDKSFASSMNFFLAAKSCLSLLLPPPPCECLNYPLIMCSIQLICLSTSLASQHNSSSSTTTAAAAAASMLLIRHLNLRCVHCSR